MRILITAPYNEKGLLELEQQLGEVIYQPWKEQGRAYNESELLGLLSASKADAFITEHDQVTARVIEQNNHLRFIGVCRGTPSNVSLPVATKYNIPVFYTPARNAQAVAEMFIANVITFLRHTLPAINWLRSRKWDEGAHTSYLQFKGNELAGKKIGIVGFGAIGQLIARLVENYPCEIYYYDPFIDPAGFPSYHAVTLEQLFSDCDIVSVHLPVLEGTKGMIDQKLFQLMQPHALFVNTSRAVVVNRNDLYEVLSRHKIKGAILDVFDNEPPDQLDYNIIDLPNVIATPHIAGATTEVEDHHVKIMNEVLTDWLSKNEIQQSRLANPQILLPENKS
ncbi:MAG: 2-hydroxyacid dehydrogenase [Niabella sp.]